MKWAWLVFISLVIAVTSESQFQSPLQTRQFSGHNNQRPQVRQSVSSGFSKPQILPTTINSVSGKQESSLSRSKDLNEFSADSSFGLGQQYIQPTQGRFWTNSGGNYGRINNGWSNNNNNYWNGGSWNGNNNGWNQGGQKYGSCGRPVPYNSFNQNLNSGYYFDRSDDETKNAEVIDSRGKRQVNIVSSQENVVANKDPKNNHQIIKRGYSTGPTPYQNQGGSFGAGVGFLSGYSLPGGYNRYNTNYFGGGAHGSNTGYYGGFQSGNFGGKGWTSSGRYCIRDYDCPGNQKCCGTLCTNPIFIG